MLMYFVAAVIIIYLILYWMIMKKKLYPWSFCQLSTGLVLNEDKFSYFGATAVSPTYFMCFYKYYVNAFLHCRISAKTWTCYVIDFPLKQELNVGDTP